MTPYVSDADAWQESWDRQQEGFLPDREHRITAMLDVVAAVAPSRPRLLDLAGGTGSITLRALARFRHVESTVVDLDPVLTAIAEASLGDRATVVSADLNHPSWTDALAGGPFDAVLTATALHWLRPERLTVLFGEIRDVLRPGGVFVNADHMPDDTMPDLSRRLGEWADARREALYAAGARLSWQAWWERVAADPGLAPLAEKRKHIYPGGHSAEWHPPAAWHVNALREAGFSEAGVVWRGGLDAAVAGVR
ncbi:class I SAM-dependent methyltransferase [Virgisporangium ochraceum]|uniref:Methyltransferase n=1 Tax=Virgisporangium ochraceum TaxID=65505 RepID=A0A8J4EB10_9ACTN|nr:class I SAM-dependent methyltransferase [Virgisporangium ochraceum]GIJ68890.1 methyltransferase [Virgisporangium ochraceum]